MVSIEDINMEPPRKRSCVTRSMTASLNEKKMLVESSRTRQREKPKRTRYSGYSKRKYKQKRKKSSSALVEPEIELCDLSEEVLIAILENVSAPGLINMSKTSWLFHRLCHTDTLWRHRAKVSSSYVCETNLSLKSLRNFKKKIHYK